MTFQSDDYHRFLNTDYDHKLFEGMHIISRNICLAVDSLLTHIPLDKMATIL